MATITKKPAKKKAPAKKISPTKARPTKKPAVKAEAPAETNAQIIERGLKLAKRLESFGVQAGCYGRPPDGKEIFSLGRGTGVPGTIMIWPGASVIDISIIGSKKLRQAVLTVSEPKRTLQYVNKAQVGMYADSQPDEKAVIQNSLRYNPTAQGRWRGPVLPDSATYRMTSKATEMRRSEYSPSDQTPYWSAEVTHTITATVPQTVQHFLVGFDEVGQFISVLPRACSSIEDAHEALRPRGVKADALRQGEFFFVPATKKIDTALETRRQDVEGFGRTPALGGRIGFQLEPESSHRAELAAYVAGDLISSARRSGITEAYIASPTNVLYVKGTIADSRAAHHSPLQLDSWHKVVRNAEVVAKTPARTRRYD